MNEGHLKYFGVLLCLFAIAALLPPAMAYPVNVTYATWGAPWVITTNYNISYSPATICAAYGGTPWAGYTAKETRTTFWFTPNPHTQMVIDESFGNVEFAYPGNTTTATADTNLYPYEGLAATCNIGGAAKQEILELHPLYNSSSWFPLPSANFTASPTSGTVPLTVSFTDTSLNVTASDTFNWSVSPAPGVSITTPAAQNTQMTFGAIGNYTITHGLSNAYGSSTNTKTDYIYVYNSTSTTTLHVTAINALNAYPIHGAQVNLYDVQNNTWSNTTTTDGTGTITALSSHTVNAYASSAGFSDGDKLGIPVSNVYDSILLFPANATSVSAGNVTLFVSVFDSDDHSKPIVGAGVTVVSTTGAQGQFTNSGGIAQFAVPNKTTVWVDAQATGQGYLGATQSVYTGTGSGGSASVTVTIYLSKKTVTPTVTATTLPGGGTPTPTVTILPGCEDPMSAECQASQNDYSMGWLSQNGLMLVQFFILCFIIFMIKGML